MKASGRDLEESSTRLGDLLNKVGTQARLGDQPGEPFLVGDAHRVGKLDSVVGEDLLEGGGHERAGVIERAYRLVDSRRRKGRGVGPEPAWPFCACSILSTGRPPSGPDGWTAL